MSEQTRYYIKEINRTHGAPNWAIYERTEAGTHAVCLCYDEQLARRIMRLLLSDDATALTRSGSNGQEPVA
jgi:hypothetical protein